MAAKVETEHGSDDDDDAKLLGKPQLVKSNIRCDTEIVTWDVQLHKNNNSELADPLGSQPFFSILSVELRSVDKKKKKNRGSLLVIEDTDNEDGDDEDASMKQG